MINVSMEMEQYDCPFVHASDCHDVAFSSIHCDAAPEYTEVRMAAEAGDRSELESGLSAIRGHGEVTEYELFSKVDNVAKFRTVVDSTAAMQTVREHDGYITGPFHTNDGTETWRVGFDDTERADDALASLERTHEFDVLSRENTDDAALHQLVQNAGAAMTLIEGCKDLSDVERETLERAAQGGYFQTPRETDLGGLAEEFDISRPAVSKNLRRGERTLMERVTEALELLEDE